MKKTPIIGLCGKIGNGKSLTGALLAMAGFRLTSFAAPLRAEVHGALVGEQRPPLDLMPAAVLAAWESISSRDVSVKPTPPPMRVVLQWWGTEYRRQEDPNYWSSRAPMEPPAVFTDARYPDEQARIHAAGGVIWEVRRPGIGDTNDGIRGHASEAQPIDADLVLMNDVTLEEYVVRVQNALASLDCPRFSVLMGTAMRDADNWAEENLPQETRCSAA